MQNCIKAAIALVCTTYKRQLLFALLQLIAFVCTTVIENILSPTPIFTFWMSCWNCQRFYGIITFAWTIATIKINITLLQLVTLKGTTTIDKVLCTIAIDYLCCRQADIVTYRAAFATKNAKCKWKVQNIKPESLNIINYNNSNDNCTLTTA